MRINCQATGTGTRTGTGPSVGFLERHLTLAGSSKMAETMYAQLLRFSEQANFVTADRKILDAKIYQFTN